MILTLIREREKEKRKKKARGQSVAMRVSTVVLIEIKTGLINELKILTILTDQSNQGRNLFLSRAKMSVLNEQTMDEIEANSTQSSYDEEVNDHTGQEDQYTEYNSVHNDDNNFEEYEEANDETQTMSNVEQLNDRNGKAVKSKPTVQSQAVHSADN
ncbi:hypothetical protein BpHYR1_008184, partial [Brachionus plicatilis]